MLIKKRTGYEVPSSEITSQHLFLSRRQFMKGVGAIAAGTLLGACRPEPPNSVEPVAEGITGEGGTGSELIISQNTDELGQVINSYNDITHYNNFYEFTTTKEKVADKAKDFKTSPWEIEVGGLVRNAGIYDMSKFLNDFDQEERIYRMRCVEGWSMVIPWQGFPLAKLLAQVEPTADAKFVRFETLYDPERMPGQKFSFSYDWPYVEGLRLDEAMNDLTILATGIYGQELLPQNGAPIRLVIPWKYGLKGIKSIVKIELVDTMPTSLWMAANSREYGFYSNVNPDVSHPRWSQSTERRIGESSRRPTLRFNGYEEQVASLYAGMDLKVNF